MRYGAQSASNSPPQSKSSVPPPVTTPIHITAAVSWLADMRGFHAIGSWRYVNLSPYNIIG
jgi:hypothetical protein